MPDNTVVTAPVTADGAATNPLRAGLPDERITNPCTAVFFGASGDLFKRMLLPAVYAMRLGGTLPSDFALIGFARTPYDDDGFRQYCKEQLDEFMPEGQKPQSPIWDDFAKRIGYVTADFNDKRHFVVLKDRLAQNDKDFGTAGNHLFYLATPPPVFPEIIKHLKEAGLDKNSVGWTRVVVEKPFGTDLASGAGAAKSDRGGLSRERDLSHRPLPRQRACAGYPCPALRKHDLRTDLESQLRRERADHVGRVARRRAARRLL